MTLFSARTQDWEHFVLRALLTWMFLEEETCDCVLFVNEEGFVKTLHSLASEGEGG